MADISNIKFNNVGYDIMDAAARAGFAYASVVTTNNDGDWQTRLVFYRDSAKTQELGSFDISGMNLEGLFAKQVMAGEGVITPVISIDNPEDGIADSTYITVKKVNGKPVFVFGSTADGSLGTAKTEVTLPVGASGEVALKSQVDAVASDLAALVGTGNVTAAIDSFNEIVTFLNGIDKTDPTLANQLLGINDRIDAIEAVSGTVDDALSDTSTKPVQNKVIKGALDNKADKMLIVNITIGSNGNYTADKTLAEIRAAYAAGTVVVAKNGSGYYSLSSISSIATFVLVRGEFRNFSVESFTISSNGTVDRLTLMVADVAISGSYNDLSDVPDIPAEQIQSDWNQTDTTAKDYIKNKPAFATVATSGSYTDLSNKPTIPDTSTLATKTELNAKQDKINDLATIRSGAGKGATSVQTISVNGASLSHTDGNISLSAVTGLQFDGSTHVGVVQLPEYVKKSDYDTAIAEYVKKSDYNTTIDDIYQSIPSDLADMVDDATHRLVTDTEKSTWNGKQDAISDLATIRSGAAAGATAIQQADLAAVATSGSYDDLTDKPNIPTAVTVDSTITQNGTNPVQGGAIYSALEGKEDRQVEIINLYYNGDEPTWTNSSGDPMTVVQVNTLLRNSSKNVIIKATFDDIGGADGTRLYHRTSPIDDDYILFYALEYKRVYWLGIDADLSDYSQMYLEDIGTVDISSYVPTTRKINNKSLSSDITLTSSDVGAVPTTRTVNGKALSSNITLTASDVGALPSSTHIPADQVQSNWNETNTSSKAYIQNKPTIPTVPTKVSSFTNDAGYLTQHQSLANYYTKSEIDTKIGNIETLLASI